MRVRFHTVAHEWWPLLLVLACFGAAACVVPTLAQVATTDDWAYTRSVQHLVQDGDLTIYSAVAATAVGQVLWGGLFGWIFEPTLGITRLSTVAIVALGGGALYDILRQLGITRSRSALGVALHLFNPVTFMLAFSFMTDPHFMSVMLLSLAFYLRGVRSDSNAVRHLVLGSLFASWALLIRQQGVFIPIAVGSWWLLAERDIWSRRALTHGIAAGLLPILTGIGYLLARSWIVPISNIQDRFLDEAVSFGWSGFWHETQRMSFIAAMYLGATLAPLVFGLLLVRRLPDVATWKFNRWTFPCAIGVIVFLSAGLWFFTFEGRARRMPYVGQFANLSGLGPNDIRGGRPRLGDIEFIQTWLTAVAWISVLVIGGLLCRALSVQRVGSSAALFIAIAGFWQWVGTIPPSMHYLRGSGSLDRYLIPLFPLGIALALWALKTVRVQQVVAWAAIAVVAVFSTIATRDYLVLMDGIWDVAATTLEEGVPITDIEAGSAWDGYHIYVNGLEVSGEPVMTEPPRPWWIAFYARRITSLYIVTTNPAAHPGYIVVSEHHIDSWIPGSVSTIYLVKKEE